ncbi:MAG TPA: hypothetical protein VN763_04170, partial [Saprospiraceae bacterium]|nr:hypothetical protein [Saprospiraceae bacterium]
LYLVKTASRYKPLKKAGRRLALFKFVCMKLRLNRSGGLTGKLMQAEVEWELSEKEYQALVSAVRIEKPSSLKKKKDAFTYSLEKIGTKSTNTVIDPGKVPSQYDSLFKALFESLKVEK